MKGQGVKSGPLNTNISCNFMIISESFTQMFRVFYFIIQNGYLICSHFCSGTKAETLEFMAVCVRTVHRYPITDLRSPVFIFERLCSIIYPVSLTIVK